MTAAEVAEASVELTLNELIDRSRTLKDELETVNQAAAALKQTREAINTEILARMEDQGIDALATDRASVTPGSRVYASIRKDDRQAFFGWLFDNPHAVNLLGNSLFADALLEWEQLYGELPPGVSYYRKATLNMRRK